jgi:glyoxylase I family protein
MLINKVHHIAIICSDYQKSKSFYTEVLGFTVLREVYRAERKSYKLDLALHGEYVFELFSFPQSSNKTIKARGFGVKTFGI